MSKKSNLKILQDAVARIKKAIENDDGQNPLFSETMAFYENKWLNQYYIETTKSPKPSKKAATRPKTSDNSELSVRQNYKFLHGEKSHKGV
jgi:hypothetical protein